MKPSWTKPFSEWKRNRMESLSKMLSGLRTKKYSLDPEKEAQKYERLPSWTELGVEFVNRTTWHGLKYISIPSRFLLRRLIWIAILISNAVLFIYIMTTRKDYLMTYPSTITVEVSYKDVLPFSAITICNHNPYRLTAMQQLGLYDLLVNDLGGEEVDDDRGCGYFKRFPGICRLPDEFRYGSGTDGTAGQMTVLLNETTRSACMRVCEDAYDWYCSGVFYDRRNRSCVLSPYTGDWLDPTQPPCPEDSTVEFYRRYRCADSGDISCNFEDAACTFTNDTSLNDQWQIVEAAGHYIQMDNTLDLASGHVANLLLTELRPGYSARFESDYMNTTGKCLQLFYWLQVNDSATAESATLSIILVTEERQEIVALKLSKGPKDWSRQFVRLRDGVHQVVIEGRRGNSGQSGICLDDIVIKDCSKFDDNQNCKVTRRGRAYMGTINVTASGQPCLPWESIDNPLVNRLPDKNPADAENFCRNIPQQNWSSPSCFVRLKSMAIRPMPCDIPHCACPDSSYFKCNNGMCLPRSFLCNGVDECLDGSDELDVCNASRSIECYFDTDYKCGYASNHLGALRFLRISASDLRYYYGANIISANVSALEQLMLVDSKLGQMGDQVQLVSPLWTFNRPTLLRITYLMMGSPQPPNSKAGLYLYQYSVLHVPVRLLFSATTFMGRDLKVADVCVPSGTYHLMFLGIQGIPYESDFAIDIVKIVGDCSFENIPLDNSFNCNFMTMCGYRFISTSALFNWTLIYTNNAFMTNDNTCSAEFGGVEGVITSPGYPNNYPNDLSCKFSIKAPPGVTIVITFREFDLEPESDCLFDRLEIHDPFENRTKVYCGDGLPPPFTSKGNVLNFLFITDNSVNNGRFKISYETPIVSPQGTDFAVSLKYSGLQSSKDFVHSAKLISPTVAIVSNSCVTIMLMAASNFTVKMAYLYNQVYTERLLLSSPQPLGGQWHKLFLTVSPSMSNYQKFVVVFETAAVALGTDAAIINDIRMLNGSCRNVVTNGSVDCQFSDMNQCGYLDVSNNSVKWLRNYDKTSAAYFMQAYFDRSQPEEAVLQSIALTVTAERCVKVTYYSSSQDVRIRIESIPPAFLLTTQMNVTNSSQLTFGNAYIQQNLPVGNYSIVLRGFLQGDDPSLAIERLQIYRIETFAGQCCNIETVDDSFCTFDNPNLCGYTINYPFGAPWIWAKFDNLVKGNSSRNGLPGSDNSFHDNVMMYNGSSPYALKGILLTSDMWKTDSELMIFEMFTTSTNSSTIEVYTESRWFHSFNQLPIEGRLVANRWTSLSVCLPTGLYRVMFSATASPPNFVAIDNVNQTGIPCNLSSSFVSDCLDPDHTNCNEYHLSWSPQFAWRYTSDIRNNTIIPGGDGCVHVFYETEGIIMFNETGKQFMEATTCDLYIKGRTTFVIEMWFEEFEIKNCSLQFLEIWTNNGSDLASENKTFCNNLKDTADVPLTFRTDQVVQIKIFVFNGFPRFRLRYKYIPDSMTDLFLALHFIDSEVSGTFETRRIAQYASKALYPSNDRVCIDFDFAIQSGLLEVEFMENDTASNLMVSTTILEWSDATSDSVSWEHGTFEVPLQTGGNTKVHVVFYISIMNATFVGNFETFIGALKNVVIYNGNCNSTESTLSVPSFCQFSREDICGFRDSSQDSSRWVRQSFRAEYSTADDCKVSLDGHEYVGNESNTISGRRCQPWDQQYPHAHNQDIPEYFPDRYLADAANHCRNPSNPFIVRSSWCYTMDPRQRREYCDIPFCLDYIMKTQLLANDANRAVLVSPLLTLDQPSCLAFRYQLTSTVVELAVKTVSGVSSIPETISTFSIPAEPISFVWRTGYVNLSSNATQIYFVADKLDVSDLDQFVSLDNISITEGPCFNPGSNGSTTTEGSARVPYDGPKLPKNSYIEIVLRELENTTMQTFTGIMAHQLRQLIHRCDYGQQPCNDTDFLTEFTDMGQCYTFNYDPAHARLAFTTGAESGTRLVLNVEQYEHVMNYVSGVGIKMHLHDQNDISNMKDLGVAAMPGVHNLATISYTNIESLIPPFGSCGSVDLPYYSSGDQIASYTEAKCRMESKTKFVEQQCHCKDIYMPGPSPVCTLKESIYCKKHASEASLNVSSSADCPTACNVNSFTVGLSQSQLSGLDIDTLLGNRTDDLRNHYINALEIRHRIDEQIITTTIKDIESLISRHKQLKDYIYFAVLDRGTSIPKHIEAALQTISRLVLDDIVDGGGALLSKFESAYLINVKPRESYLRDSSVSLHARLSLSKDLFRDLENNLNSSWYAQIFQESVSKLGEFSKILSVQVHNTNASNGYLPKIFTHPPCQTYRNGILASIPNLTLLFENFTGAEYEIVCNSCDEIIHRIDDMLMLLSNFSVCNSDYGSFLVDFRQWLSSLNFDFKEFSNAINSEQVLNMFIHNDVWLTALKRNYSQNVITKLLLADRLLSDTSLKMSQDIDNVIQDVGQQIVVPLQNKITSTEEETVTMYVTFLTYLVRLANYTLNDEVEQYARSLKFWRKPKPNLEVPEMLEFTLSETETWQVWPPENSMSVFVADGAKDRLTLVSVVYFSELSRQLSVFMADTKNYQSLLLVSMDTIKSSLLAYNDTTKINDKFVTQNFLMLDIYYGEMKYEHISQSEAYTWTNFFSELGSYFGLLMGCSLLTMIEVLDLVIYYSIVKVIERYQTPPRRMEVIEVNNINLTPV